MKSKLAARTAVLARAVAPLVLLSACASACARSQPAATEAVSSPRPLQTTGTAQVHPQPAAPATSGVVSISEEVRKACGIASDDAYFAFDSSAILSVDVPPLNQVATCFTVGALKGRTLRLVGHADPRGTEEYNLTLGQHRADSVEGYLDRHGVRQGHIATTSRGAMDAMGHDETGWANDRRVDVMLGG